MMQCDTLAPVAESSHDSNVYCPRQMMECGAQGCRCSMAVHRYTRNAYTSWLPRESPLYTRSQPG